MMLYVHMFALFAGKLSVRTLRSLSHQHKDRTPAQAKRNHPDTLRQQPGQWKKFTDLQAWRNRQPLVEEFDAEKLDAYLAQMNVSLETENDMVKLTKFYYQAMK